ncbi:hypothetical protein [Kitasatospora sp. NPDC093806]|uniref:hypothetical protein n=1 Tax=Kitasatospora sp. NPDC093806 TaxID=3155075 RepID=UPI00344378CE
MLEDALIALAQAGGSAVVQAAGTSAWNGIAARFPGLFGRRGGDEQSNEPVEAEPARLRRTREALAAAEDPSRARAVQEGVWQERFRELVEEADGTERALLAAELLALVQLATATTGDTAAATGSARATDGGLAVTGIRRTGGTGPAGPARASHTGPAVAEGAGSKAISGISHEC